MCIAVNIQQARKAAGLTQTQLAEKIGKGFSTVQKYEMGLASPPVEVLQKIASALGVSLADLVRPDEPDREYELICDTLNSAGYSMEPDVMADNYYIAPMEDPDDPETRREIEYSRLAEIVHKILSDAETNKAAYIQKRIEAELFGWKTP